MRTLGLFFFLFGCVTTVNAQMVIGVRGGLNLSDIVLNNLTNPDLEPAYQVKAGLHAGVFVLLDGENEFGLVAELLYSNKGVNALNRINLHYVTIPLLLRYHLNEKWVAEAGPEIGYLVSANSRYGNLNSTWDNKLDVGLDAGLHYRIGKAYVGLRFNAGFLSVIRNASGASGEQVRYLNRAVQLSLSLPIKSI
ncbi:MAG TPA: porin family protein [Chryseosolibacter sp.]